MKPSITLSQAGIPQHARSLTAIPDWTPNQRGQPQTTLVFLGFAYQSELHVGIPGSDQAKSMALTNTLGVAQDAA